MKISLSSIRDLYRLKNITRYNPWSKINKESVAEHSYYVVLFTMILCRELKINSEIEALAIKIAVVHDIPEIITNDITYDAKEALPGLKRILSEYEDMFYKTNFDKYDEIFRDTKAVTIANTIVKLADIISAIQYIDNEVVLGNTGFIEMLQASMDRFEETKKHLERNGIECQKITI